MTWEKVEVLIPNELLDFARGLVDGQERPTLNDVIAEALTRFRASADMARRAQERAEVEEAADQLCGEDDWFDFVDDAAERMALNAPSPCPAKAFTRPN